MNVREGLIREMVRIPSEGGSLSGELGYPVRMTCFAALLVNPHPHMGGLTGNNVMTRLAEALSAAGGVTLTFDYTGVGTSDGPRLDVAESMSAFWETGVAPEDPRMLEDTRWALRWLSSAVALPVVAAGYSFGAYASAMALTDAVRAAILISPTIEQHDFSPIDRWTIPKLILHSDDDFATPREAVECWAKGLAEPKRVRCLRGGNHFFRGREDEVADACVSFVEQVLEAILQ